MTPKEPAAKKKEKYEAPKVLATYEKEELEAMIRPEGNSSGGCG